MDLTCVTVYPPIPDVPKLANDSNTFTHQTYNPASGGLAQIISASLVRSTFSINDVRSLIDTLLNEESMSWSVSEVVKIKPVPSIIIYTSIALALFLVFSIIFCATSCCCSKQRHRRRRSTGSTICVGLLVIVYLLGIGDTIYVAYRLDKAKGSIDDTIKTVNEDIYPRAIVEHVEYLSKEIDNLNRYTVNDDSILINASKSMLVEAFDRILTEKYLLRNISQTINITDEHFAELNAEVNNQSASLSPAAIRLFQDLEHRYRLLHIYIQMPIQEVCNYTNGTHTDVDVILLEGLDIVHLELARVNETMRKDILSGITPWHQHMFIDQNLEDDIRKYSNIGGIVLLVLVILLGAIPLVFFCLICICRTCGCCQNESDDNLIPMVDVTGLSADHDPDRNRRRRYHVTKPVAPGERQQRSRSSKKSSSSGGVLCLMRIAFFLMMIILILLVLLTGVFFTGDLALQGSCRSIHDDQPYLINVLTEQLIKSHVIFGNVTEMNQTISNIINDCGNQTHFSRKLLNNYWSTLANYVEMMMNRLDERIYEQFIESIDDIDIATDKSILTEFGQAVNVSSIQRIVANIEADFTNLEQQFALIIISNSTLPPTLIQPTIDRFEDYMKNVLESTIDACPLPLPTISKTDKLICHTLGGSISGLWLSIFIFVVIITFGCCIFGICVYKRLNAS